MTMEPSKFKRIVDILSDGDVKGISAREIQEWEEIHSYKMKTDPQYRRMFIDGKIKFNVVNDRLEPGTFDTGFNTPQEAEHFTKGYGDEPTRGGLVKRVKNRIVRPYGQYYEDDPVRKSLKDEAGLGAVGDVVQDAITHGGRVGSAVAPIAGELASVTSKLPKSGGPATAILSGLSKLTPWQVGLVSGGISALSDAANAGISKSRGEDWYARELLPSLVQAGITGGTAAAIKALDPDRLKNKSISKIASTKLGIKPEDFDPGLIDRIREPLEAQSVDTPAYTVGDWKNYPMTEFDELDGALDAKVTFGKKLPYIPKDVPKDGAKAYIPMHRDIKNAPLVTDGHAKWFLDQLGLDVRDYNIDDVKEFIREAYLRPYGDYGMFYPRADQAPLSKEQLGRLKHNTKNPFTKERLREDAQFDDPELTKKHNEALKETSKRYQKIKGKAKTPIVSNADYDALLSGGGIQIPFWRSGTNKPIKIPLGRFGQLGSALLGGAASFFAPDIIKWLSDDEEE